jgi:hypothetical protein
VRGAWLGAGVAVALSACASPAVAAPALSQSALLARLTDPVAALAPLDPGVRVVQPSSHDLRGGNADGGTYDGVASATNQPQTYVRREDGGYVLLDIRRPGCLVREWMTAIGGSGSGDLAPFGRLQLFFDGEDHPRLDEPATDFFAGRDPRFPQPLVGDHASSSGGNYSYVPFCFARSLKLRVTSVPSDGFGWWQSTLLLAPAGTPVQTFSGADASAAAAALKAAGAPPAGAPGLSTTATLAPGGSATLAELGGAGTVRSMRLRVSPFDAATLSALHLRIAADGASAPQVDVPLGDLFGDGLETRPVASSAFGMEPAHGVGWFALPIPYRRGARISIAADRGATVRFEGWTGGPAPAGSGTLYGERIATTTELGRDFPVLRTTGSGRLAALVLDYLDGAPTSGLGLQSFMEGDERVHVDGSRSPSLYGTGTEDAFNGGFYYANGAFTLPTHGAGPYTRNADTGGAQSQYRVFGDDGVLWGSALDYGMEHGGGDEHSGERVAATTFSYRAPPTRRVTGVADLGAPTRTLDAYFEGDHDGNLPVSTVAVGGLYYPAPPPSASPEGFAASGIAFAAPVSYTLAVDPRNRGVTLRRLTDRGSVPAPLAVTVDGAPAGTWTSVAQTSSGAKRWLEDDYALGPGLTAGRSALRITLTPAPGTQASLYRLEALSDR